MNSLVILKIALGAILGVSSYAQNLESKAQPTPPSPAASGCPSLGWIQSGKLLTKTYANASCSLANNVFRKEHEGRSNARKTYEVVGKPLEEIQSGQLCIYRIDIDGERGATSWLVNGKINNKRFSEVMGEVSYSVDGPKNILASFGRGSSSYDLKATYQSGRRGFSGKFLSFLDLESPSVWKVMRAHYRARFICSGDEWGENYAPSFQAPVTTIEKSQFDKFVKGVYSSPVTLESAFRAAAIFDGQFQTALPRQ